ncbi:MAG: hypothetical protein FWC40_03230 [Proteobacteria bacterium]|nr:hypothetical protein [Pseudomonadota bacterium]
MKREKEEEVGFGGGTAGLDHAFKQSALADEFARDRDYIISSLQEALKSRQYVEANKIVRMYREVGSGNRAFMILADLAERFAGIEAYIIQLDATPLDAYRGRVELCDKILEIAPEDETYRAERERCMKALGSISPPLGEEKNALVVSVGTPAACCRCGSTKTKVTSRKKMTHVGKIILWLIIVSFFMLATFLPYTLNALVLVPIAGIAIPFMFFRKYRTVIKCQSCSAKSIKAED